MVGVYMTRTFCVILLLFAFSLNLFPSVSASDVEGTVAVTSAAVPDTSDPEIVTIKEVNNNLSIIQSQLWIFLVILISFFCYKFLRVFF